MKNFKSLLAVAATVAISGAANAQVTAPATTGTAGGTRIFAFTGQDIDAGTHEDADFQNGQTIGIQQTTNVDVEPYFYVTGSIGGDWVLNGWDATESQEETSVLSIYHNADFTANFEHFGNPKNGAGDELNLQIQEEYDTAAGQSGVGYPKGPAAGFNGLSPDPTGQIATDGYLTWTFKQYLSAPSSSPAGNYTVTPKITFTSNAN